MPCVVVHVSFCLNVKPHKNQMNFFVMSSYIKPTYLAYLGAMQCTHLLVLQNKRINRKNLTHEKASKGTSSTVAQQLE